MTIGSTAPEGPTRTGSSSTGPSPNYGARHPITLGFINEAIELALSAVERADGALRLRQRLERERNQLELVKFSDLRRQQRSEERHERTQQRGRAQAAKRATEQVGRERQALERNTGTHECAECARAEQRAKREEPEHIAQQQQREAAERLAHKAKRDRKAAERGETVPMTGHEAADILAVSRPTPGVESPHRQSPEVQRGGRENPRRRRAIRAGRFNPSPSGSRSVPL